jgi:hypothetical protein
VTGEKEPGVSVDIGLGAKASLEAKVSTEIPAQSTGRLVDALTDILRPFSERRGLKADQIRLQREEVLIEIARKAHHRLEIENQPINPLPNKFLVPFLEKASLEELDSVLMDRWADLLASSSADPGSAHPRYVQILSEITADEAHLLHLIAFNSIDEVRFPGQAFFNCPIEYEPQHLHRRLETLLGEIQLTPDIRKRVDDIYSVIIAPFENPGVSLIEITADAVVNGKTELWGLDLYSYTPPVLPRHQQSLDVLYSLHLLQYHHIEIRYVDINIDVYYTCMTSLGTEFLDKCEGELHQKVAFARS